MKHVANVLTNLMAIVIVLALAATIATIRRNK
jgi:hypothetical protein